MISYRFAKLMLLASVITATSLGCSPQDPTSNCSVVSEGPARLVAYRVAKHSRLWLENTQTGKIQEFSGLGGRRIPTIDLGQTITVKYCGEKMYVNLDPYVTYPTNKDSSTKFVPLPGYEHLY